MDLKNKIIKLSQMITIIMLIIIGIVTTIPSEVQAYIDNSGGREIFIEDNPSIFNSTEARYGMVPQLYGYKTYCLLEGAPTDAYMTTNENHYEAWGGKNSSTSGIGGYNWASPLHYYRRAPGKGLRKPDHKAKWLGWVTSLIAKNCHGSPSYNGYVGDEAAQLASVQSAKPGSSILYLTTQAGPAGQPTAYVLSSMFDDHTIQDAMWDIGKGQVFAPLLGSAKTPLSIVAKHFGEFYKTVHELPKEYEDVIEAKNYNEKDGSTNTDNLEETRMELDGESDLKTFIYKDTQFETDPSANKYVLGPFYIDYTVDDAEKDTYYVNGQECKFDAIEDIKIYNQRKENIVEKYGASFEIVEEYPGQAKKVTHCYDPLYYPLADGRKVDAFESRNAFYIVVTRPDTMKAEDFKNFYAKVKFQYLDSAYAQVEVYEGNEQQYTYSVIATQTEEANYSGTYNRHQNGTPSWTDPATGQYYPGTPDRHIPTADTPWSVTQTAYEFEIQRDDGGVAQPLVGRLDKKRTYKTKTIVITSEQIEHKPDIELEKICKGIDDEHIEHKLHGARFDIELKLTQGKNIWDEDISGTTINLSGETDKDGKLSITSEDIKAQGLDLTKVKDGHVKVTFDEVVEPLDHKYVKKVSNMEFDVNMGKISNLTGDNVSQEGNSAKIVVENVPINDAKIRLTKVTQKEDGSVEIVKEASFDINFAFEDENGKRYEETGSIKGGTTSNGYLDISYKDLDEMLEKNGLNVKMRHFTGKVILDVVEISAPDGYVVKSEALTITLTFEDGVLVEYSDKKNQDVLVNWNYEAIFTELDKFAENGDITKLPKDLQDLINTWAKKQEERLNELYTKWEAEGKRFERKDYDDILAWLAEYLSDEENREELKKAWEASSYTQASTSDSVEDKDKVIEITIENFPGRKFPDIPEEPLPDLMTVAGTVFLDEHDVKAGVDTNGKLDPQEKRLYGIEVVLHDITTGGLAELAKSDDPSKDHRTNPTLTDENGNYEFRGVDPMHEYYVEFRYNAGKYTTTESPRAEYNSPEWAVSSKGSELASARVAFNGQFSEIYYSKQIFDYEEIEGLRIDAADYIWSVIKGENRWPGEAEVKSVIAARYSSTSDIDAKLDFMLNKGLISAYAGYSSVKSGISSETANGIYPYYHGQRFLINDDQVNEKGQTEAEFAGNTVKLIYPGQKQIHLGLVNREVIDLSLETDLINTTVSVNKHDTEYEFNQNNKVTYTQYFHEEDYNPNKEANTNGTAFYTEDGIKYYATYEVELKNLVGLKAGVKEVVNYYNNNFNYKEEYTTTKGNKISGIKAYYATKNNNEWTREEISGVTASGNSSYQPVSQELNVNNETYNKLFITGMEGYKLDDEHRVIIEVTFEMNQDTAKILREHLEYKEGEKETKNGKIWKVPNYAEIACYTTSEGYLDRDSHPGNFKIKDFEDQMTKYVKAYSKWLLNSTEEAELEYNLELNKANAMLEHDAWKVNLNLTKNKLNRFLNGNVWEAINKDIKNSLDLQETGKIVTQDTKLEGADLEGIRVELVELVENGDDKTQEVRATTKTAADGSYRFDKYRPGNYSVRFIYGEKTEGKVLESKLSTTTYDGEDGKDYLPINGQYYQSTKANENTDKDQYWYKQNGYIIENQEENMTECAEDQMIRFSDAHDDAYTRLSQMNSNIAGVEKDQTSSDYAYDGVLKVQSTEHNDPIYAYTSTMELEVEYIRQNTMGTQGSKDFAYNIGQIDFGVTPKAHSDLKIDKWVSNIKIYEEAAAKDSPLLNANVSENGKVEELFVSGEKIADTNTAPDEMKLIQSLVGELSNTDGEERIEYNEQLLQRATLEITYKIRVRNDSEHDGETYDTIKYIYNSKGEKVAVAYYREDTEKLVCYEKETDTDKNGAHIVYHNELGEEYSNTCLGNTENTKAGRFTKVRDIDNEKSNIINDITTKASQIIDYPTRLDFEGTNYAGEDVNKQWKDVENKDDFISSRKEYSINIEDGNIVKTPVGEESDFIDKQQHVLTFSDEGLDENATNNLYAWLKPGESREDTLVLKSQLNTRAVDVTADENGNTPNLTIFDLDFANLAELTRIENSAGRITDIEGYDINGETAPETSQVRKLSTIIDESFTPTLGTSKSVSVMITSPTGLDVADNILSNLSILLVVLIVFAGGIVLIKKYVIVPKKQD